MLVYSLGVLSIRAPFPRSEEPRGDEGGGAADDVDGPAAGDVDGAHLPEPAAVDPVRREAVDDEAQRGEGAVGAHVAPVGTRNSTQHVWNAETSFEPGASHVIISEMEFQISGLSWTG